MANGKLYASMALTFLLLFGVLFFLLMVIGFYFSVSIFIMLGLSVALIIIQWAISPMIVRSMTKLRPLEPKELPWLREAVENMCKTHKVPMPKLAVSGMAGPNAFVFGRTPGSATLAVTEDLLKNLTRDEVKAVIGHELGHIKHRDMVLMTIVSVVPIIAYYIAISLMWSRDDRGNNAVLLGIGALVVYFISNLIIMGISRLREYYSDDFGGRATKPGHLASALAKITYGLATEGSKTKPNAARSFFIADPASSAAEVSHFSSAYADKYLSREEIQDAIAAEKKSGAMKALELLRTHPLCWKRIQRLQELEDELNKK